ncbi:hypothetical protein BBP40_012576 [Aspergillus hancockii]|nr:hypothetical protein BBP40_012576 [Aspergillus hancockii]
MSYSSGLDISDRNQHADLVNLVVDVASALGEALKDVSFVPLSRQYRDLKMSLALLLLEIRSGEILQALAEIHTLERFLQNIAKALNSVFRRDYIKVRYQHLVTEEMNKLTSRTSFWPS